MERWPAAGAPAIETSWKTVEVAIPVKCNIHPWMHGYFVVVKGPYAVTNEKGSYTIEGVPAGNYTVTAWQEEYGTQTAKVTGLRASLAPRTSRLRPNEVEDSSESCLGAGSLEGTV